MKILVVFHSRTGNTRRVAREVAEALGADLEEIKERADRSGVLGYIFAGRDASEKRAAELVPAGKDPAGYDLVVVGTPIWAFTLPPAVRTWLEANRGKAKRFAAFCTCGGSGGEKNFAEMEGIAGMNAAAKMSVFERELNGGGYKDKVAEFCRKLK